MIKLSLHAVIDELLKYALIKMQDASCLKQVAFESVCVSL